MLTRFCDDPEADDFIACSRGIGAAVTWPGQVQRAMIGTAAADFRAPFCGSRGITVLIFCVGIGCIPVGDPLLGVELGRVEAGGDLVVLAGGDLGGDLDPFRIAVLGAAASWIMVRRELPRERVAMAPPVRPLLRS